jgi:hypothetical protein
MKFKSLIVLITVVAAVASCATRERSLSDKLTGVWSGSNAIEITMIDSSGNTVIQELSAPIEIEYNADSTFTAVITINDSNIVNMGGIATFNDSLVSVTGSMSCAKTYEITGDFKLNPDGTLLFSYTGTSLEVNVVHKGNTVAVKKVR